MYYENRLRGKIAEKGLSIDDFAKATGIKYPTLRRRMNGETDWERNEIQTITIVLALTPADVTAIFFADDSASA